MNHYIYLIGSWELDVNGRRSYFVVDRIFDNEVDARRECAGHWAIFKALPGEHFIDWELL